MITHSSRVSNCGRARPGILAIIVRTLRSYEKFPRESIIMPMKLPGGDEEETRLNRATGRRDAHLLTVVRLAG
jgi:hypothetical protein